MTEKLYMREFSGVGTVIFMDIIDKLIKQDIDSNEYYYKIKDRIITRSVEDTTIIKIIYESYSKNDIRKIKLKRIIYENNKN